MPRKPLYPSISVPGVAGSHEHIGENRENAYHRLSNPQGQEPPFGGGGSDLSGGGIAGGQDFCTATPYPSGVGSGIGQSGGGMVPPASNCHLGNGPVGGGDPGNPAGFGGLDTTPGGLPNAVPHASHGFLGRDRLESSVPSGLGRTEG